MELDVRVQDADAAELIRYYAERRLQFALARFGRRVGRISVRVDGAGKSGRECRISAELRPSGRVLAREAHPDLFAAIDRAAGRISSKFAREVERRREARRERESVRTLAA